MRFANKKKALALVGGAALGVLAVPATVGALPLPEPAIDIDVVCSDEGASIVVSVTPAEIDTRDLAMFVEIVDQGVDSTLRYDDYFDLAIGTYTFPDDGLEDGDTDIEGPYVDGYYRVIVEVEDTDAPSESDDVAYRLENLEIDCRSAPPATDPPATDAPTTAAPTTAAAGGSNALPETGGSSSLVLSALVLVGLGVGLLLVRRGRTT